MGPAQPPAALVALLRQATGRPDRACSFEHQQRAACENRLLCGTAVDLTAEYQQAMLSAKRRQPLGGPSAWGQAGRK